MLLVIKKGVGWLTTELIHWGYWVIEEKLPVTISEEEKSNVKTKGMVLPNAAEPTIRGYGWTCIQHDVVEENSFYHD